MGHDFKKADLVVKLNASKGKTFGELDKTGLFKKVKSGNDKGIIGKIIEQSVIGYESNPKQKPDLTVDGKDVELKSSGLKLKKSGEYRAKERLVVTNVSPAVMVGEKFKSSHFWDKVKRELLIFYVYSADKSATTEEYKHFKFKDYYFFSTSEADEADFEEDWTYIQNYYAQHPKNYTDENEVWRLRGLKYLEVVNKKKTPRIAICQRYFNGIVSQLVNKGAESIPKDNKKDTLEENIQKLFAPYIGVKRSVLAKKFGVTIPKKNAKGVNPKLARRMLKLSGKIEDTIDFTKAGIVVKTLTIKNQETATKKNQTKEGFKLGGALDFTKVSNEKWGASKLRKYLLDAKFMLVAFQMVDDDQVFVGIKFWQVPDEDLEGRIKNTWLEFQRVLKRGVQLTYKKNKSKKGYEVENDFPNASDQMTLHVRPTPRYASYEKSQDSCRLPVKAHWHNRPESKKEELGDSYMTKQAFWLNPAYMYQQVEDLVQR